MVRKVAAVAVALVLAVLLVSATAWIGDALDLRWFNSWTVMHATGIILFPLYFGLVLGVILHLSARRKASAR